MKNKLLDLAFVGWFVWGIGVALTTSASAQDVSPLPDFSAPLTQGLGGEWSRVWQESMLQRLRINPLPMSANGTQSGRKAGDGQIPPTNTVQLPTLALDDVLRIVTENHPKLRGADVQRRIATEKRIEKQGAFDPVFTTGTDFLRFNSEFDTKTLRGKPATSRLADAGVEFLTRYGLKVAAGTRYHFGKIKAPLAPTGSGGEYFIEFKMPLLRGARINEKSAAEKQALLGEPLAETEYEQTRLGLILKAAESYWEWVAAKRKLDVARDLLTLAEFRAKAVRDRVAAGDLPAIDATEADLEVQRRQGGLTKAERDLQKAAFKLSLFLWTPDGQQVLSPEPSQVPTRQPNPIPFTDQQLQEGRQLAQQRRPELKALNINRQITQVDLDLARNQRLPAVDFTFSPGRDVGTGAIGNTVKAGLSFTLPLRQRTADGRIGQASYKIQKIELDTLSEAQRISTEIMDAVSAINTTYERYRAAEQEVALALQLEEGERTKFQLGDSTLFLVNQRERSTAEARMKLIEIQAEYEQAVATFRTATVQY
ncbi:MAG: TolC family protein [Acidobacteria bacterium]|nr:TolC family protein [Acidobacteriota bacterium]